MNTAVIAPTPAMKVAMYRTSRPVTNTATGQGNPPKVSTVEPVQ